MSFTLKKSNLNFKVYTVPTKPTTAGVENDIAIISSVPMPNWMLSPDKPSGTPRSDGDVWIQYSVSGNTFNALKNNSMMIATISAWQYVDGAWVDVTAYSYQGGEWVGWITYIAINENDWYKRNPYSGVSYSDGTYEFSGNSLKGKVTGKNQQVSLVKKEKVDFSDISEVKFVYSLDTNLSSSGQILVVVSRRNDDAGSNSSICEKLIFDKATKQTVNLDVSGVSGQYYLWIGLACWENLGTVNFEISNLEFV